MRDIAREIADAMPPLSHLECDKCARQANIDAVADKLRNGWPSCCGYTMRLVTRREADLS